MRSAIYVAAFLALAATDPPRLENALASSAAILFESIPYICASLALQRLAGGRARWLRDFAGCGCSGGGSARSIPAALATVAIFGPLPALARVIAGCVGARMTRHADQQAVGNLSEEIEAVAPLALTSSLVATYAPVLGLGSLPGPVAWIAGLAIGILAPPCGFGALALAASVRTANPALAYGVLCTAGLFGLRPAHRHAHRGDFFSYVILGLACAIAAHSAGAGLFNPRLAPALALCVPVCLCGAWQFRNVHNARARAISAALLLAAVVQTPPPLYRAMETTLDDAFVGEHVIFTGVYLDRGAPLIERYAITCCRADASPVAIELAHPYAFPDRVWVRAEGTLQRRNGRIMLAPSRIEAIVPPRDPFVYR